jgi:polysaccharide export outer membrane protein
MKTQGVVWGVLLAVLSAAPALAQPVPDLPPNGSPDRRVARSAGGAPEYRLVTGDKLRIEVYKDPQLSQSLQIRPDGKITLPLIGDVVAAGVTPRELTTTLTERLTEWVRSPSVTVIVAETMPPTIYVMGEVNTPGAQPMPEPISVIQALAIAGGFKDFANPKKIRILRKGPNNSIQTINFNYREAVARTDSPMLLQSGDTIIVP